MSNGLHGRAVRFKLDVRLRLDGTGRHFGRGIREALFTQVADGVARRVDAGKGVRHRIRQLRLTAQALIIRLDGTGRRPDEGRSLRFRQHQLTNLAGHQILVLLRSGNAGTERHILLFIAALRNRLLGKRQKLLGDIGLFFGKRSEFRLKLCLTVGVFSASLFQFAQLDFNPLREG